MREPDNVVPFPVERIDRPKCSPTRKAVEVDGIDPFAPTPQPAAAATRPPRLDGFDGDAA